SGGSEQSLASNYAFRTEQAGVTALNNDGIIVDTATGSLRFGNFALTSSSSSAYNQTVLGDHPVAFWNLNPTGSTEADLTGNGNTGTYVGGSPTTSVMPNGDQAAVFNGSSEYLTVQSPSNGSFSIPTTGNLTWEVWIQPAVLQFPHSDGTGDYVDIMGKCASNPTCEWESRMYNTNTPGENPQRPNRMSAYVFNPGAGKGSGADWQPVPGLIQAGEWLHIVGEYTTLSQPADCPASSFPGSINIWVNGVLWNQAAHNTTGCMSQFSVAPKTNNSPLNIGTMATDTWFEGAIAKVAIYNYLLTQTQITNHYQSMTGKQPTGNCNQTGGTCTF
ncbi:MAG: LamG-like jellyroll fold domain-containing protein, partial [Candidatus Angelobacter sp.]